MEKQIEDKKDEVEGDFIADKKKLNRVTKSIKKSLHNSVKDAKKAAKTE